MPDFKEISPSEIASNPFDLIGKDWALIAVNNGDKVNMMTASWGGVGIMWNKPVAFTFIRPQRFSFGLLENEDYCSLSFFDESFRDALTFCGTKSGRDFDKVSETGLTVSYENDVPYFEEAKLVLICRKMYTQFLNEQSIIDVETVSKQYTAGDYHKMYINEIVKVLTK